MSPTPIAAPTGDYAAYLYDNGALALLDSGPDRERVARALLKLGPRRLGALAQGGQLLRGHNARDRNTLTRLTRALAALPPGFAGAAPPPSPAPDAPPAVAEAPAAAPSPAKRRAAPSTRCELCDEPAPAHSLLCPKAATPPPPRPEADPRRWPAPSEPVVEAREEEVAGLDVAAAAAAPPDAAHAPVARAPRAPRPSPRAPDAPRPTCEAKGCEEPAASVTQRTRKEVECFCLRHRQTAYERSQAWRCDLETAARTVREGTGRPDDAPPPPAPPPRPTCEAKGCEAERGRSQRNTNPLLAPFCREHRAIANERHRYAVGGMEAVVAGLRDGTLLPGAGAPPPASDAELCEHCGKRPRGSRTVNTPEGTETWCGPCRREVGMKARGTSTRPHHTMRGLRRGQRPTETRAAEAAPTKEATMPKDTNRCAIKNCKRPTIRGRRDTPEEVRCFCPRHATTARGAAKREGAPLADVAARMKASFDAARPMASGKALAGKAAPEAPAPRKAPTRSAPAAAARTTTATAAPLDLADPALAALAPLVRCARVVERLGGIDRAERLADALEGPR